MKILLTTWYHHSIHVKKSRMQGFSKPINVFDRYFDTFESQLTLE